MKDTTTSPSYSLKLRSVGNPDFGQFAPISTPQTVTAETLSEVVEAFEDYRDFWNLGSGNMVPTFVMQGKRKIARISYNGRLWNLDGSLFNVQPEVKA